MSYSNGQQVTYVVSGAAIDTAAIFGRFPSLEHPENGGLTGRIVGFNVLCTVQLTGGAPSVISIGDGSDADAYGTITVPDTAANARAAATYAAGVLSRIPADSVIVLTSSGGHTAGDGDVYLMVEWS